jgi:hypothetical protein
MPIDFVFIVAALAGLSGAAVVAATGARRTPNRWLNGAAGASFGVALGVITHVMWRWCARGVNPLKFWTLPVAAVTLLLVMSAQNWFVFYEDRQDAFESAKPALVLLIAALAGGLAAVCAGRHFVFFPILWAGMGSWAIILCLKPLQRSIEANRSVLIGGVVGLCKVLLPLTGFIVFIPMGLAGCVAPQPAKTSHARQGEDASAPGTPARFAFWKNLLSLSFEAMLLLAMTMTNGGRVARRPAAYLPLEYLSQVKHEESLGGEMPPLRRNLAVLVLVLALHVLCGVAIVRS